MHINIIFWISRPKRQLNWLGTLFMRFGASCCPAWDPSNWLSRKIPTLMSFWMSRSAQNENQKLLRTASEEEMFKKKPKRKTKGQKSTKKSESSDCTTSTTTVEIVKEAEDTFPTLNINNAKSARTRPPHAGDLNKQESADSQSSVSEAGIGVLSQSARRQRRSRREQAALAAKSSRGGGKGAYTAANLRRYAAERKPKKDHYMLEKRSQSASALKISPLYGT